MPSPPHAAPFIARRRHRRLGRPTTTTGWTDGLVPEQKLLLLLMTMMMRMLCSAVVLWPSSHNGTMQLERWGNWRRRSCLGSRLLHQVSAWFISKGATVGASHSVRETVSQSASQPTNRLVIDWLAAKMCESVKSSQSAFKSRLSDWAGAWINERLIGACTDRKNVHLDV